jgi:hypothetical protein
MIEPFEFDHWITFSFFLLWIQIVPHVDHNSIATVGKTRRIVDLKHVGSSIVFSNSVFRTDDLSLLVGTGSLAHSNCLYCLCAEHVEALEQQVGEQMALVHDTPTRP